MTTENITPINIELGPRSVLSPRGNIFIGIGDRDARYRQQLDNDYMPLLMATAKINGMTAQLCQTEFMKTLEKSSKMSEMTFSPALAFHALRSMSLFLNNIKTNAPVSVRLNYRLPGNSSIRLSKTLTEFCLEHEEFLMLFYTTLVNPPPAPKPVEETPVEPAAAPASDLTTEPVPKSSVAE